VLFKHFKETNFQALMLLHRYIMFYILLLSFIFINILHMLISL